MRVILGFRMLTRWSYFAVGFCLGMSFAVAVAIVSYLVFGP